MKKSTWSRPSGGAGVARRWRGGREPHPSIGYQPVPLQFQVGPINIDLAELGPIEAAAEITVLTSPRSAWRSTVPLAQWMAHVAAGRVAFRTANHVQAARGFAASLYSRLLPAIRQPLLSELGEEYFVFHFAPGRWRFLRSMSSSPPTSRGVDGRPGAP